MGSSLQEKDEPLVLIASSFSSFSSFPLSLNYHTIITKIDLENDLIINKANEIPGNRMKNVASSGNKAGSYQNQGDIDQETCNVKNEDVIQEIEQWSIKDNGGVNARWVADGRSPE